MTKNRKMSAVFLALAALLLFATQSVHAFTNMSVVDTFAALESDPAAVMFDTRTVDEHNHLQQPWQGFALDTTAPAGTAMWTVGGVDKLPITVPYWYAGISRVAPGPPEDEAEVVNIIEGLLAAGTLDFDTPIYLICRTAYRSYYMAQWMETLSFYNAITGVSGYFTNLINIDSDTNPANAQGGMKEWNLAGLPIYGGNIVSPQIFSISPKDGDIENVDNTVTFTMSVLEPSTGGFVYPAVNRVALTIDGVEVDLSRVDTTGLWTDYTFPQTLPAGVYVWNSSAENSAGTSWNSNFLGSGLGGRTLYLYFIDLFEPESVSAQTAYNDLIAVGSNGGPIAVMFETRTVDEYYGCSQPWYSTECPDTNDLVSGTPMWTVTGAGVAGRSDPVRLPYLVPYWITANSGTGPPENPAEARKIIEELLATGAIDFDTRIYLICRTAYRSYYMGQWMNTQRFYNDRTGTTEPFISLFNIDSDGIPNNGLGGMKEWKAAGLPFWNNAGNQMMPAQIYANLPDRDGYTENDSTCITFTATILEPTAGVNGAITGYTDVLNTCVGTVSTLDLATNTVCSTVDTPPNTVVNRYELKLPLANGTYLWTAGAENYHVFSGSKHQASPNATGFGLDTRTLTVNAACTDMDCDGYALEGRSCGPVDCDDSNAEINPGATEICDNVDNNCDGAVDEGVDSDSDGYAICDCDDSDPAINPSADDSVCDGIDDNCDGITDNNYVAIATTCGVGECAATGQIECVSGSEVDSCVEGAPAAEVCDDLDNDCDGSVDENYVPLATTCGVGECASTGETACVDGDEINSCAPGTAVAEVCDDGLDNDCDGAIDTVDSDCITCTDNDNDGYSVEGGDCGVADCDDSDAAVNPGATEGPVGDPTCNDKKDNDCDGRINSYDSDCQYDGRKMHRRGGHGGR